MKIFIVKGTTTGNYDDSWDWKVRAYLNNLPDVKEGK